MITTRDLDWTAGFLDGEGSFIFAKHSRAARVMCAQVQTWPLERLQSLYGGVVKIRKGRGFAPYNDIGMWVLSGTAAAGLMMTLYPLMSPRRQSQIKTGLEQWKTVGTHPKYRSTCPEGHRYDMHYSGKRRCKTCYNHKRNIRLRELRELEKKYEHLHFCRWCLKKWSCGHLICELPYSIGCEKCNKEKLK